MTDRYYNEVMETCEMRENVKNPSHYSFGEIEPIHYIKDKLSKEAYEGFCIGNVIKYVSRYKHKNGLEDLMKAKQYLEWAIKTYE